MKFMKWVVPILGICYGAQLMAYQSGRNGGDSACQRIWTEQKWMSTAEDGLFQDVADTDHLLDESHRLYQRRPRRALK